MGFLEVVPCHLGSTFSRNRTCLASNQGEKWEEEEEMGLKERKGLKGPDKQIQIDDRKWASENILNGVYLSKHLLSTIKILDLGGN